MYGPHMSDAKACSPCHTLISNSADLNGNLTGTTFVEQATYHEFLNSNFPGQESCQSCHMPSIEDPVKIANGYLALPGRTPFNLHSFQGGNAFMVQLIKDNKVSLGVTAPDVNFDSTLKSITTMLRTRTVNVTTHHDTVLNDTLYCSVQLMNKAGHKFPSGYPSRRAFVQFIALKANGDTLFASGLFNSSGELQHLVQPFQPHYEFINTETQTQIYEMVMGDVNGNKTTVLERGFLQLKDNRLPPEGFTTTHPVYDTCKIVGNALSDSDFNKIAGIEGSGADIVQYHVPLTGYTGTVSVKALVYYQTVPPDWLSEMQNFTSAEIDTFLNMYAQADNTPFLVGEDSVMNIPVTTGLATIKEEVISVSPNPTYDGMVTLRSKGVITQLDIYTASGALVQSLPNIQSKNYQLRLPESKGMYYVVIRQGNQKQLQKIIRL